MRPRSELLRLTVDHKTGEVILNQVGEGAFGRSAYLCLSEACFLKAQKGRLRHALEGRRRRAKEAVAPKARTGKKAVARNAKTKVNLHWPLEPQLIKVISELCAERGKNMPKY